MRPLDLILGKLLASALPGIFGFLAAAPLLAIPFLLGGVTASEFVRVIIVLSGTLFLSLVAGIFSSSHTARSAAALKQTAGALLSIFGLGVIGILNFRMRGRHLEPNQWHRSFYPGESPWIFVLAVILFAYYRLPTGSPCFLLHQALTGAPGAFPFKMNFFIGTLILFGMTAFFLASARPFLVVEGEEAPCPSTSSSFNRGWIHPRTHFLRGASHFKGLLGPTDAETILTFGWAVVAGALHIFSNGLVFTRTDESIFLVMSWGALAVTSFVYFLFARRTAEFLVQTRRNGLLRVLLVTPVTWTELLFQHRAAFLRFTWFPASILLIGEIVGVLAAFNVSDSLRTPEFLWSFLVVSVLSYICSLFATLWASIFFALRTKSATHAAFLTVLLVLVVPAVSSLFVPSAR